MAIHVVLHEPEIPQNTGNIARTCAGVGAKLHLIRPLGFSTSSRELKRAGLDYWHLVEVAYYESIEDFLSSHTTNQLVFLSTKAPRSYTDLAYRDGCCLIFGKESAGLPEELLERNVERTARIPIRAQARSLNLSSSAAVVVYEALRQLDFPGLLREGRLKGLERKP